MAKKSRSEMRKRRHIRVRKKIAGTSDRPRLNVFRSLNQIYAQLIDDSTGQTVAAVSTLDPKIKTKAKKLNKTEQAKQVGDEIAKRAKKAGITAVIFDRGGYKYHGRVKALADAAREAGLEF
jgi:large subunit ribosomal protein L18